MATKEQKENQLKVAEDIFGYSPCMHCKHLHDGDEYLEDPFVSCDAFPDGIPGEIFEGENLHKEPYEGDNGIRFEESEEEDDEDG